MLASAARSISIALCAAALWCLFAGGGVAAEGHWAYITPQRPPIPLPAPAALIREPVDAFIHAELERRGLQPAAEADRRTLLRRLSLTLHGIQPRPEEVEAFARDPAPDAYEQQVDRLLASPLYGQRMATDWLDLARFADTHGYHADTERQQWRWRDWVIDQLNAGQPFDQFTLEQLAGDLLPNATLSQRIATGFQRNHRLNDEGGAIPEEFLAEYAIDRLVTAGSVWLGQTLVCARCHDHKYEALTQREFYGLVGIFNSLVETPVLVKGGTAEPRLPAPTREQQSRLDQLNFRITQVQIALQQRATAAIADQRQWEQQSANKQLNSPPADAAIHLPLDRATDARTPNAARPAHPARIIGMAEFSTGMFGEALLGDGSASLQLPNWPVLQAGSPFTLSAWVLPTTRDDLLLVAQMDDALYFRGVEWSIVEGHLQLKLTQRRGADELVVRSKDALVLSRWQHLAAVFSSKRNEVSLWLDGKPVTVEVAGKLPPAGFTAAAPLRVGGTNPDNGFRGLLDEVRLFSRALSASEIELLAGGNPIADIVRLPPGERTAEQRQALERYYLENHDTEHRRLASALQNLRGQRDLLQQQIPTVLAAQEMPEPRPTFLFVNGQYDQPGEEISRQTPDYLSQQAKLIRKDRLGFARWLIDPLHPLTGRVAVNRAWQQVFGTGLVATPEDFGVRGSPPSHPELLDWLAREFVDTGWDTKRLQRRLIASASFRQRSEVTAQLRTADPDNRWLARFGRERLAAEAIRDMALAAAGLLDCTAGGPGVTPYQPGDLWKDLSYDPSSLSAQSYRPMSGSAVYRRSVYLFWKRASPPVNLTSFDAPNRETCTVRRMRTNTPLQALVLLNDPTFVEAARVLAARVLAQTELSNEQRIDQLLTLVLSRPASKEEQAILLQQLTADLEHYRTAPAEAEKLLKVGQAHVPLDLSAPELAAWTNLALAVLNLDEAITNH